MQIILHTSAYWTANNPVLPINQLGKESDTVLYKVGDGITLWNSSDYMVPTSGNNFEQTLSGSREKVPSSYAVQVAIAGAGGGEDLEETLTIGNNAGGIRIINTPSINDASDRSSYDVVNRRIVRASTNAAADFEQDYLIMNDGATVSLNWQAKTLGGGVWAYTADNSPYTGQQIPDADWVDYQIAAATGTLGLGVVLGISNDAGSNYIKNLWKIQDNSNRDSVMIITRELVNTSLATTLDWETQTLSGEWYATSAPTVANGIATKSYVDTRIDGLDWKEEVLVRTTANIALSGEQTIDGVLTSGSRVLVMAQADQKENGIYLSAAGAWSRTSDADTGAEIYYATMMITKGTLYANTQWTCTNSTQPTIGVDNITFGQVAGAGVYTADGTSIDLTGNVFSIKTTWTGQIAITTLGTIGTGTWNASVINMTYGGSGKNLSPSNGGIVWTDADSMEVLAGTATAGQMLRSGAAATPAWSTNTWPNTTGAGQILYATSANVIGSSSDFVRLSTGEFIFNGTAVISGEHISIQKSANAPNAMRLYNSTAGGSSYSAYQAQGSTGTTTLYSLSGSFSTSGMLVAGHGALSAGTNQTGLDVGTVGNVAMAFWTNDTKRGGISNAGAWNIANLTTNGPVYTSGGTGILNSEAQTDVARGGTGADLSGTGGAKQIVWQTSVGGDFTVAQASMSDLSDYGRIIITTGDQSTTNATAQNITDLVTPSLTINKRYHFKGFLTTSCNNTGGVKFAITIPTGASMVVWFLGRTTSGTAFFEGAVTTSGTLTATAHNQQNAADGIWVEGEIIMGGTAGTVQFQFASGVAGQTSTILQGGTYMEYILLN